MFGLLRRLDPDGYRIAVALERGIEQVDWPGAAWLIEESPQRFTVASERGPRLVEVRATWDMDPWLSCTYVWIRVEPLGVGPLGRCRHRGLANHAGEDLPEAIPASQPVDLAALLPRTG